MPNREVLIGVETTRNGKYYAVCQVPDGTNYEGRPKDTMEEAKADCIKMLDVVKQTLPVVRVHWTN